MRNWKKSKIYCRGCGSWRTDIQHRDCSKGTKGSLAWIDIENFEMGCNKCNLIWRLEDNTFYCSCGHVQKTEYRDSAVVLEAGDQIIATDGDVAYILRRSGTVVVGRRSYTDHGYEG